MGGKGSGRRPKSEGNIKRKRRLSKTRYQRLAYACQVASTLATNEKLIAELQEAQAFFESLETKGYFETALEDPPR
jgi:hypothetical protein